MTIPATPAGPDPTIAAAWPSAREIAAVVVLFDPDVNVVRNIGSYIGQVHKVIAIDNSEDPEPGLRAELEARSIDYVPLGINRGVATALNIGCRRALASGYQWVLTMDQDSTVGDGFVSNLTGCLDQPGAGAIGIVAPVAMQLGSPRVAREAGCEELTVALTSGSLVRLLTFQALGGFREDLFIDQVDHEFCLRARRGAWRVVRQREAVMLHRMGTRRLVSFPRPFRVSDYSPLRRYYMVRNTLELRREYGREFPDWLRGEYRWWRRELPKMLLAESDRLAKLRMMMRGWHDYRRGRFGKYDQRGVALDRGSPPAASGEPE